MALLMGPVLSFRGVADKKWNLSALVVCDKPPGNLSTGGKGATSVAPEVLWKLDAGRIVYRYLFSFPMTKSKPTTGAYTVLGQTYELSIPGADQIPTMAYASCNGFSSLKLMKTVDDKNAVWKMMADNHSKLSYHLLLLGGDQVYADAMWETLEPMVAWSHLPWKEANNAPLLPDVQDQLYDFFFRLYTSRWSQPEVAAMLARIPNISMWDDHDLTDGWGSYPSDRQDSPYYDGIWKSASKAFAVFQQHLKDGERRPGTIGEAAADWWEQPATQSSRAGAFSFAYTVGPITILAIDMRSQRTATSQVVGAAHWKEIYDWIEVELPKRDSVHFLVMSSIPVVYPGFDTLETLLGFVPGHQDLEDDLRDHWNSPPHKTERLRMIHNLLDVPDKKHVRTTLISGDVHVAALGIVQNIREKPTGRETVINQLISSGIVHPGPGAVVVFALQHLFDSDDEIDQGIIGRMLQIPGTKTKFLGGRNYLSIEPDRESSEQRLWCNWQLEGAKFTYTKVIHPITPEKSAPG